MKNKTTIIGIVNRGATIIADTYFGYDRLKNNFIHESVKHSAGEYVKKDSRTSFKVHTNSIEGFWSQMKRGINGIYHWASEKRLVIFTFINFNHILS